MVEQDAKALGEAREEQHRRAQPVLTFTLEERLDDGISVGVELTIRNDGAVAREIFVTQQEADGTDSDVGEIGRLDPGHSFPAMVSLYRDRESPVTIQYVDINNSLQSVGYWFRVINDKPQMTSMLWEPER